MEHDKMTYVEALEHLAKKQGITLSYEGGRTVDDAAVSDRAQRRELLTRVSKSFSYWLLERKEGEATRIYLKERGILQTSIEKFSLGYAPVDRRWLYKFLSEKSYSKDFLLRTGLFSRKYPEVSFFSNRLVFPICDRDGQTIAFGGRLLSGEGPKYLNSPDSDLFHKSKTLYGLHLALPELRKKEEVWICEGYFDVIALSQVGVSNAVAPLGTAFTEGHVRLLSRWCKRIFLAMDSDSAGVTACIKAIGICRAAGLECKVLQLKEAKDPADLLERKGAEALQKALGYYINDIDYLLDYARNHFALSTVEGKDAAVRFILPFTSSLSSEVARSSLLDIIADALEVDRQALARDYQSLRQPAYGNKGSARYKESDNSSGYQEVCKPNDELRLLITVLVNRQLFRTLRSQYTIEDFKSFYARELFIALEEAFRHERGDIDFLLERIENPSLKTFVLEQAGLDIYTRQPERIVEDGLILLRKKKLQARRTELMRELRRGEDGDKMEEILLEKMHVDSELEAIKSSVKPRDN